MPNKTRIKIKPSFEDLSYPVIIGQDLDQQIGEFIRATTSLKTKIVLVSDKNCSTLFAKALKQTIENDGFCVHLVEIDPGEQSKSFAVLERVIEKILSFEVERNSPIIAIGGGVVGDLAGLVCALVLRGLRLIQVPTSLLAQIDSSIGGKTAINSKFGKNLIGSFYHPEMVFMNTDTLSSLSVRQLKAGYAEAVKYGLIDDADFFEWLEKNYTFVLKHDPVALNFLIKKCVEAKARIVSEDSSEKGRRALLNLGHSFAHALEGANHYQQNLLHGEAVAVGLVLAFQLSYELNLCPQNDLKRVKSHLKKVGLATSIEMVGDYHADDLLQWMKRDKKVRDGKMTLILTRGIGQSFIAPDQVDETRLYRFLQQSCNIHSKKFK
ncbi:MAG: 3-dehydroquinate synthase [Pseudomonadota bacterium]